jgi:hypothetical protein
MAQSIGLELDPTAFERNPSFPLDDAAAAIPQTTWSFEYPYLGFVFQTLITTPNAQYMLETDVLVVATRMPAFGPRRVHLCEMGAEQTHRRISCVNVAFGSKAVLRVLSR